MNRWIGAALALALAACVLAPPGLVFAEDAPQAAASEAVLDLDEHGEAGAEASITGTVRANLVSATLPSNIAFTFDPAAEFDPTAATPLRAATLPADSTVPLEIYGKLASDRLYGEYGFSVGVTLKVRALQSGESWDYLPSAN